MTTANSTIGEETRVTTESLHRAMTAMPFRPFTLRLADGQQLHITHPELIAHAPGARIAVVVLSDSQIEWVDLLLAVGMVFDETPSSPT
jgi:hypothetical protein